MLIRFNVAPVHKSGCLVCCVAMMKKGNGDSSCAYDIAYDLAKHHTNSNGDYTGGDNISRNKSNLAAIIKVPNHQHYAVVTKHKSGNIYYVLNPGSSYNTEMTL